MPGRRLAGGVAAGTLLVGALLAAAPADAARAAGASPGALPAMLPGVSGGPPVMTRQAGYVASGQLFRYAQAVITVPPQPCRAGAGRPSLYVALAGRPGSARAGLLCDAAAGRWRVFASLSRPGLAAPLTRTFATGPLRAGDAVFASVYRSGPGSVRFFLTGPGGAGYRYTAATGSAAGYGQAQALAGWTQAPAPVPPSSGATREARFLSGGFTTASGEPGTFEGPWALTRWEATGGAGPAAGLLAAPGYPGGDGSQRLLGTWGDAFGVWLYAWPPA
jgi:hypothetical protein